MADQPELRWYDLTWQKEAHDWIRVQLKRDQIRLTGEIEQPHAYAWSTVMRVPTSAGMLFFKATAGETIYEIGLTQMLSDWFPDCMPELVAADSRRGWMLMRDGGEQLRSFIRPTRDIKPWEPVLARYAEIQIRLAEYIPEILALGIPDHRLALLPRLYAERIADRPSLLVDQEKGLTSDELQQLQQLTPRFGQICADLASIGIPESLNNGDFHDGNVLVKEGRLTFFDWGDATVTHPFVSLRTLFVSIEMALKLDDYSFTPDMASLLDLYLEPWLKFASKQDLLRAYDLSKPIASIVKVLLWHGTISQLDGSLREQYAWIVPELFREFLYHTKHLQIN
jgi:hypothetical protein